VAGNLGRVVVALAGPTPDTALLRAAIDGAALMIAADSGALRLAELSLVPDLLIGDFDSLTPAQRAQAEAAGAIVVPHPDPEQITDGAAAMGLAVERGASEIVVLGVHGGARMDLSLGNLLALFDPTLGDMPIVAIDGWNEGVPLRSKGRNTVRFNGDRGDYVSLLPISERVRVSSEGLRWALTDTLLERGASQALSNELTGRRGGFDLQAGIAFATHTMREGNAESHRGDDSAIHLGRDP
jgi:thiamine pyrophosphokinase